MSTFFHVADHSINLALCRLEWSKDGSSVTVREHGCAPLILKGVDRDLLAAEVGWPAESPETRIKNLAARRAAAGVAAQSSGESGQFAPSEE